MGRIRTMLERFSRSWLGRSRRVRIGLVALGASAIVVLAAPAPAMAAGDNYYHECANSWASCQTGTVVGPPSGLPCASASANWHYTTVCVDYSGDYVYVKDRESDGNSAVAMIQSPGSVTYRACRNPHGVGSWARCNFDWSESGTKYVNGGVRKGYYDQPTQFLWKFSSN
jgi:hypothetical protein